MLYEYARDVHHRGLSAIEAANEYLRIFSEDGGLAAGFRIGCRRRMSAEQYGEFRRYVRLMEGT
jgi:hypothetical protein